MTEKKAKVAKRRQGSIISYQRANGEWSHKLKFDAPDATPGARRTVYKTVQGTRREAERELAKLIGQAEKGVKVDENRSLAGWAETWLEDFVKREVSTRTYERYADLLRHHVVPRIGAHPLRQLGPYHIEKMYQALAESGRKVRKLRPVDGADPPAPSKPRGLAPRTIHHIHRALFRCLKDAQRLQLIEVNPAANARRPRLKRSAAVKTDASGTKMKILAKEDLSALLARFRGENHPSKNCPYSLILTAIDTGARRGELLAIPWPAVDCDGRTIRIEQAVDDTKADGVTIKPELKNESSRRTVTISRQTAAVLRAERTRQEEEQRGLGRALPPDALIFPLSPLEPRKPLRPREVTKAFGRQAKAYGFPGLRFHDLRHNCASHMLAAGRSVPDVARHLGHATPAITMSVYAHAIPQKAAAAGLLDDLLSG
jgi:integrase